MRFAKLSPDDPELASQLLDMAIGYEDLTPEERAYLEGHVAAIERGHEPAPITRPGRIRSRTTKPANSTTSTSA